LAILDSSDVDDEDVQFPHFSLSSNNSYSSSSASSFLSDLFDLSVEAGEEIFILGNITAKGPIEGRIVAGDDAPLL